MKKVLLCSLCFIILSISCVADDLYSDVPTDAWYKDSVMYTKDNGLMNGVSQTEFAPEVAITRSMAVTVLYRMAGTPKCDFQKAFFDVNENDYYALAVSWAVQKGIASGYGNSMFGSGDAITREQFATMIYRYVKSLGKDVSSKTSLKNFEDVGKVSSYATDALEWACDVSLIKGMTATTLAPQGKTTRAQAATIFMRLDKLIKETIESTQEEALESTQEEAFESTQEETLESTQEETTSTNPDVTNTPPHNDKSPSITLEAISNIEKKEIKAVISIKNNTGIASLKLFVEYDTNLLTLQDVCFNDAFGEYVSAPPPFSPPQVLNFINPFEDISHNGEFATLTFSVNKSFADKTEISVVLDKTNTFNSNFEFVDFEVLNEKVSIN